MSAPKISGSKRTLTASIVLNAVAHGLGGIAAAQHLSNADLGGVLNKTDDTAGNYRNGNSEMGVVALSLAIKEWGPAFGDQALAPTGYRLCPISVEQTEVAVIARETGAFLAELLTYFADGSLNHQEMLALAKTVRPLMPMLQSLLAQADAIEGV